jgi:hypothetical protein
MKINKIRVAGVGCLAAVTGLVTAASMVLTAPADAAKTSKQPPAATVEQGAHSGSCFADESSVCSGSGDATNGSVSSGDSSADNGSVSSGCSEAENHSVSSGGDCAHHEAPENANKAAAAKASPAKAVSSNPTFAG